MRVCNVRCRQPLSHCMPRWRRVMACDIHVSQYTLKALHWLPVKQSWIEFKLCLLDHLVIKNRHRDHVMHPNTSVRLVYGRCCKYHIAFYHCDANAFGQRTMFIVGSLECKARS